MLRYILQLIHSFIIFASIFAARGLASSWRRTAVRNPHPIRMLLSASSNINSETLQIPKIDDRVYYQHILSNGVPVTIVHDRRSEKSSCALSVKTGAMNDPLPGVAHITEHAVFLGSEKYPVENAYKNFLNQHGGGSNAGTSMDQTTYKFNINSDAFDPALDLFSQFFKGPLFRTEAMCREIMAVDSEDSKNRIIDSRRLLQVLKHQVDPDSQYSKFSTGNLKTLVYGDVTKYGEHLSNTIRSFHQRYYHPSSMAVALVGPQSVEELKDMAERHFSNIFGAAQGDETAALPEASTVRLTSLFTHGGGKLIRLRPVKDLRDMTIVWEMPATVELYRHNPCNLLSYLLANKGEGSWFAALQDKQWATSTAAGVRTQFTDFTLFESTVSLTESGLAHWEEVLALLYRSIDAVSQATDAELTAYWQEMRTINALDFQYKEKSTAYELAPQLSSNMLDYPAAHIVSAGWLMDEHVDLSLVRAFLARMVSEKSLVFLRCKSFVEGPLSLGNDDSTYLDERAYVEYEAHLHSLTALDSAGAGVSGGVVGVQDAGELAPIAADNEVSRSNGTALEESKLSGAYFRAMRAYQDAEYQTSLTAAGSDSTEGVQRIEPFYGIPYHIEDLTWAQRPAEEVQRNIANALIALPQPNRFLCTELIDDTHVREDQRRAAEQDTAVDGTFPLEVMRPKHSAPPVPAIQSNGADGVALPRSQVWVWHSRDEVFQQPRSIFFHLFESAACGDGHPVLSLMSQVFGQVCARKYYQPAVAGLSYSLNAGPRGVGLSVYGYSPRLADFAAEVSRDVGNLSFWSAISPSVVAMSKDRLLRTYRSWAKERPDAQCDSLLRYLLQEGVWLPQDRLQACEAIDNAYFQHRVANALQFGNVLTYAHGDCSAETALRCHQAVSENVHASTLTTATPQAVRTFTAERSRMLDAGDHHIVALPAFNKEDPNSALLTFFQAERTSPAISARMLLLRRLLGEPAFTELRTKQQLGYIVSLSPSGYGRGWNAVRGISVRILSKRFSPLAMETALLDFLTTQRNVLQAELTDQIVQERCRAIIQSLEDPPTTYSEEASDYWDSIVHDMPFDWTAQVIAELRRLDRVAVLRAAEEWMFDPAARRTVSLMLFSPEHEAERLSLVERVNNANNSENAPEAVGTPVAGAVAAEAAKHKYAFSMDDMTRLRDSLPMGPESAGDGVQ